MLVKIVRRAEALLPFSIGLFGLPDHIILLTSELFYSVICMLQEILLLQVIIDTLPHHCMMWDVCLHHPLMICFDDDIIVIVC